MLYERHFEGKTRGIIQGPAIRLSQYPVACFGMADPNPRQNKTLNKREFFTDERETDARINQAKDSPFVRTWKVTIKARGSNEIIWALPFANRIDAAILWARLLGFDLERDVRGLQMPSFWQEGDFEYHFATVEAFTTVGWHTWSRPLDITSIDCLLVGGGGSGGDNQGGGGGGGEVAELLGLLVNAANYQLIIGSGGGNGYNSGGNSAFDTVIALGGGRGGTAGVGYRPAGTGFATGGGGSCQETNTIPGIIGKGFDGGAGFSGNNPFDAGGGGGGGTATAGASGDATKAAGNGGDGKSSSLTGAAANYGGGGGGGRLNFGPTQPLTDAQILALTGLGGLGGAANGGVSLPNAAVATAAQDAVANSGGGGGGAGWELSAQPRSGNGASGIVVISYGVLNNGLFFGSSILGT